VDGSCDDDESSVSIKRGMFAVLKSRRTLPHTSVSSFKVLFNDQHANRQLDSSAREEAN
jgi:hypothetical protein